MTRPSQENHDDPDDQELIQIISYLDGELSDAQTRQVEQRLVEDPDLRAQADVLSRTWGLLDELDEVAASKQFTKQTLATISRESPAESSQSPNQLLRQFVSSLAQFKVLPCFLAGIMGGTVGLFFFNRTTERQQQRFPTTTTVLENFELLQNTDLYSAVPNAAALRSVQLQDDEAKAASGASQ